MQTRLNYRIYRDEIRKIEVRGGFKIGFKFLFQFIASSDRAKGQIFQDSSAVQSRRRIVVCETKTS